MLLTQKEIFWKCWLWSIISGIVVAVFFWMISSVGNLFTGNFGGTVFLDLLLVLSLTGSYFGAGFVGWRIIDKYYNAVSERFVKRYITLSIVSFLVLVGVIFSPLSILALLWSFLAPLCVVMAFRQVKIYLPKTPKKRMTRKRTTRSVSATR